MISLTCTNCRAMLTIDDAFAGGVCRCQHCGTIQTVPSRLKGSATRAAGTTTVGTTVGAGAGSGQQKAQKAIYSRDRAAPAESGVRVGTGLDELAEIVASSGFGSAGSGLRSGRLKSGPAPTNIASFGSPNAMKLWLSVAGGVILVLVVVVLWLTLGRSTPKQATASSDAGAPSAPVESAPLAAGPHFCGIKFSSPTVIYVIDRGNGTADVFDTLKEATYKSIESLGPDRRFQVIFWHNGQDDSYPGSLPAYARGENLSACKRAMEDVTAFGQSDPSSALKHAFTNKADEIVLVTGKGLELEPALTQQVLMIRKSSPAKIHTVAIGDSPSPILKEIAAKTGGEYQTVSSSMLRTYTE